MAVTIPPVDLAQGKSAPGTPELPITAFRALQLANVLVKMEVSTQIGAATPTLVCRSPVLVGPGMAHISGLRSRRPGGYGSGRCTHGRGAGRSRNLAGDRRECQAPR